MENWAILIGVDKYRHQNRLRNAVADAKLVYRTLTVDYGFKRSNITCLYDERATRSRILRVINDVVPRRWRVARQDQLFVFFAGHGGRGVRKGKNKTWFLVPNDGRRVSESLGNWDTVLSSTEIRTLESTFRGAHILYVFDCCYAGMAFSYQAPAKRSGSLLSVHAVVAGTDRETVNDENGTGHSVFTDSLVQALSGWGGLGNGADHTFVASELIQFVRHDVPGQIKKKGLRPIQRPFGGPLRGNTGGKEFKLTPILPRLPEGIVTLLLQQNVRARQEGVRQLTQLPGADSFDVKQLALSRMSCDSSPSVRDEVAFSLIPNLGNLALPLLIAMLGDKDEHVLLTVMKGLSEMWRQRSQIVPHVRKFASHHNARVRRSAQACMALLGVQRALRAVVSQLPTEQGSIRREMIDVLKRLPTATISKDALTRVISGYLRHEDWRSRRAAAEALGELGLGGATSELTCLAESSAQHYMVRYAAVEALGHIGQVSSRGVICQALVNDRSLLVRTAAGEAAGSLGGPDAIEYLARAISLDSEWRVRRSAVESCGLLQDSTAMQYLIRAAADPHFRVRMASAQAIGEIGGDSGRNALEELVSRDQSLFVKRSAARALQRL
jgi:HEAT repeat protein